MGTWSFGSSPYHQYPPIHWKPSPIAFRRCPPLGPSWASRTMPLLTASMPASARSMPPMPTKSRLEARQKKGSKVTKSDHIDTPREVKSISWFHHLGFSENRAPKNPIEKNHRPSGIAITWGVKHPFSDTYIILLLIPLHPFILCIKQWMLTSTNLSKLFKKKSVFLCGRSHYDHIISLLNPPKNTYC